MVPVNGIDVPQCGVLRRRRPAAFWLFYTVRDWYWVGPVFTQGRIFLTPYSNPGSVNDANPERKAAERRRKKLSMSQGTGYGFECLHRSGTTTNGVRSGGTCYKTEDREITRSLPGPVPSMNRIFRELAAYRFLINILYSTQREYRDVQAAHQTRHHPTHGQFYLAGDRVSPLDRSEAVSLNWHSGVESQLPWAHIDDDLPRNRCDEDPGLTAAFAAAQADR